MKFLKWWNVYYPKGPGQALAQEAWYRALEEAAKVAEERIRAGQEASIPEAIRALK